MDEYLISVIIPTYNTGNFLKELFNSILNQTMDFNDIEVIIVDDASTDKYTLDLIEGYSDKYLNCKAIFLENRSGFPGTGRNKGLEIAKGEFIIFSDHDDTYQKDAFKVAYDEITSHNADVVIFNFNQVHDKIIPFKSIFKDAKTIKVNSIDENLDLLRLPAAIWTRLFRKAFLKENNIIFLEGMLAEDLYLASLTSLKAKNIVYINDFYGYNYKVRDSVEDKSTIHIRNEKYINAMLDGYFKIMEMLDNENFSNHGEIIFKQHLTSWVYTIVLSDLNDSTKYDLFKKAWPVFDRYYTEDFYFKGKYNKVIKAILDKNFEKAVLESNKLNKLSNRMFNKIRRMFNNGL